ncbi:MAG: hypothetical protein HQL69_18895 [Magnetococcales bacterium]|nr:hypothetical protein [Magnetococcales bacterium]
MEISGSINGLSGNPTDGFQNITHDEQYKRLKSNLDSVQQAINNEESRKAELVQALSEAEKELAGLGCRVTDQNLISHQEAITKAEKLVAEVQTKIAEQEQSYKKAITAKPNPLPELTDRKERILAALAMEGGQCKQADLEQVVEDIKDATEQTTVESTTKVDTAKNIQPTIKKAKTVKPDPLSELTDHKERNVADFTMDGGQYNQADLEQIEIDIQAATEQAKKDAALRVESVKNIQPTINGLKKHLQSIQGDLQHLHNLTPQLIEQFLKSEAEKTATEYSQLAAKTTNKLKRLSVLQKMLTNNGDKGCLKFLPYSFSETMLPIIQVGNSPHMEKFCHRDNVFFTADLWKCGTTEIEAELVLFKGRGITCL